MYPNEPTLIQTCTPTKSIVYHVFYLYFLVTRKLQITLRCRLWQTRFAYRSYLIKSFTLCNVLSLSNFESPLLR